MSRFMFIRILKNPYTEIVFFSSTKPRPAASNANAGKFSQKFGGSDRCPRCSKAVYAAEKVMGAGKVRTILLLCNSCRDLKRSFLFSDPHRLKEGEFHTIYSNLILNKKRKNRVKSIEHHEMNDPVCFRHFMMTR